MSKAIVIGIHGAANAGKGEIARLLGGLEVSFADPLYEMVSAMTGRPIEWLKDRRNKDTVIPWLGVSPRYLLQTLGTEWGRNMVRSDVWIVIARQRIGEVISFVKNARRDGFAGRYIAVPDVRFDNEAEVIINEFGGEVWEVVRPGAETCEAHASEAGISPDHISRTIRNDGTLADLEDAVQQALNATLKDILEGVSRDRRTRCAP